MESKGLPLKSLILVKMHGWLHGCHLLHGKTKQVARVVFDMMCRRHNLLIVIIHEYILLSIVVWFPISCPFLYKAYLGILFSCVTVCHQCDQKSSVISVIVEGYWL